MLRDKVGNRLYRRVEIKVVFPKDTGLKPNSMRQKAGPHQGFNSDGIDEMLMNVADRLDELYPWWEFKMVPVTAPSRTAKFVFAVAGYRAVPPEDAPIEEFSHELALPKADGISQEPNEEESNAPKSEAAQDVASQLGEVENG
jgi:hypothetical protein